MYQKGFVSNLMPLMIEQMLSQLHSNDSAKIDHAFVSERRRPQQRAGRDSQVANRSWQLRLLCVIPISRQGIY